MSKTVAMEGSFRIAPPDPSMEGLDELAAELGVERHNSADGSALVVEGKSGQHYNLIALLSAHLQEMRERSVTK